MGLTTLRRLAVVWYVINAPAMGVLFNIVTQDLGFSMPHFWAGVIASLVITAPVLLAFRAAEVIGAALRGPSP